MHIKLQMVSEDTFIETAEMLNQLINYHRILNNSPKEFYIQLSESIEDLTIFTKRGVVYNIFYKNKLCGFMSIRFGGQNVAWLEEMFVKDEFRNQGIAKNALQLLDAIMIEKGITSLFVDVIPRNENALKLYARSGFDHLNIIQLRKNYEERLNKQEEVEILGVTLKKY